MPITLPHAVFVYDENGNAVPVVSGSTLNSGSRGLVIYGKDSTDKTRNFAVNTSGNLLVSLVDNHGDQTLVEPLLGLRVKPPNDTETFGAAVSHGRISQFSVDYSQALANNDVSSSTTGNGSISRVSSSARLTTGGTGTAGFAKITTNTVLSYVPGREIYAVFTAAFTTPVDAGSYQRIGMFDTNNGYFVGTEGAVYGITHRKAGVNTFISASTFNGDLLTGASTSMFTRAGVPEAIDYTKKNIYRIRFGWLGVAPIKFEVLSPDGIWVNFHTIRYPNTEVTPSIISVVQPISAEVNKPGSVTNQLTLDTTCWEGGIVDSSNTDLSYVGSIAAAQAALTTTTRGKATLSVNISGTWSGTLIMEGHNGDVNWSPVTALSSSGTSYSSITTNGFYFANTAAYSQVRVRASAWTSGTANLQTNASNNTANYFSTVQGNVAAAATDAGNPVKIGGVGKTAQPTAVTDGQRTNILTDKLGRQVVVPGHIRDLVTQQTTTITNSTTETTILASAASIFNDITSLVITNAGNIGTTVTIKDATGGTTRAIYYIAAGGGIVFNPTVPWTQAAVTNNWTATLGVNTVTMYFHVIAVQNI